MGKLLFRIARLKALGTFVGMVFSYCPFLVPVKKIMQSNKAVSFKHPSASYPNHVLIIPRKIARSIFYLTYEDFLAIIDMAIKIRHDYKGDFALIINGGKRQDVMQTHFHLFTGNIVIQKRLNKEMGKTFLPTDSLFWQNVVFSLHDLISQYGMTEESFSMLIQFDMNYEPMLYII